MITKTDCLLLLYEIESNGIDTSDAQRELLSKSGISNSVLEFIHQQKPIDLLEFYKKLRKSYNEKKSKLYKEIVQVDEKEPKDIAITLASLLTQILLYSNNVDDKQSFLKQARAKDIGDTLNKYLVDFDTKTCLQMLTLVKADLKVMEHVASSAA